MQMLANIRECVGRLAELAEADVRVTVAVENEVILLIVHCNHWCWHWGARPRSRQHPGSQPARLGDDERRLLIMRPLRHMKGVSVPLALGVASHWKNWRLCA